MLPAINAGFLPASRQGRKLRKPQHDFQTRFRPYAIQPFLLAPVLPGETLKNALVQARVRTMPIVNPLIGWWSEMYFFYVKLRDMPNWAAWQNMVLDPAWDFTTQDDTTIRYEMYHHGVGLNWTKECLVSVVEEFFRDEGDTWNTVTNGGTCTFGTNIPIAKMANDKWWMSGMGKADHDTAFPDWNLNLDLNADGTIKASEASDAITRYEWLRSNGYTDQSYEDWIRTYGVKVEVPEVISRPELLRYVREWSYPTNTVEPTTGVPSSAVVWSHSERIDKARFFKEPGFIFGVQVVRPKVYFQKQAGAAAHTLLKHAKDWLPPALAGEPHQRLREFTDAVGTNSGPVAATSVGENYWIDVADLYLYGDQFLTGNPWTLTDMGFVAKPGANMQKAYADSTSVDALFVGTTEATRQCQAEGVVKLSIASTIGDEFGESFVG